jgi:hypothetical protein
MKKLLTGVATFIALASALPAFASDLTADRNVDRAVQTAAPSKGSTALVDSGRGVEAKKTPCACSCMKSG